MHQKEKDRSKNRLCKRVFRLRVLNCDTKVGAVDPIPVHVLTAHRTSWAIPLPCFFMVLCKIVDITQKHMHRWIHSTMTQRRFNSLAILSVST